MSKAKGRHPRQRRTPKRRVRDKLRISQLYLMDGLTQEQIAAQLGISPATVNRSLKELEIEWKAETAERMRVWKASLFNEAVYQLEQWYEAWLKSKQPPQVDAQKVSSTQNGKTSEVRKSTEERAGNPAFLAGAGQTLDRLMKLTGLDIQKVAQTTPDGTAEAGSVHLEQFAALIAQVRQYEEQSRNGHSSS